MKDIEKYILDEVIDNKKEKFEKLLTKICIDFKINNYNEIIKDFLKNKESHKKQ